MISEGIDVINSLKFTSHLETIPRSNLKVTCSDKNFLNPLQPGIAYLYPLKTSENLGFLMFSGGINKKHRALG